MSDIHIFLHFYFSDIQKIFIAVLQFVYLLIFPGFDFR